MNLLRSTEKLELVGILRLIPIKSLLYNYMTKMKMVIGDFFPTKTPLKIMKKV